ncbi:hypothetical protein [Chryseobacterium sp.]|uniref:DUF7832 domain-containing protein n=1 Tax=Chryseobacterium sp. TaxID=1871047 RepID=UPI00388DCB09
MAKYDDASWHTGGDYPEDLHEENAATHIGMYLMWCIENKLISEELIEHAPEQIQKVKNREITGAEFLIEYCDGQLDDDDLSDLGNLFSNDYYDEESLYAEKNNTYVDDYTQTFEKKAEEQDFAYETVYHIEDDFENYDLVQPIISQRFEGWKASKDL